MGFYTATKKNQVMIHATTYMNIVVQGKKKSQKARYHMIPLVLHPEQTNTQKWKVDVRTREKGKQGVTVTGYKVSLRDKKNSVWEQDTLVSLRQLMKQI